MNCLDQITGLNIKLCALAFVVIVFTLESFVEHEILLFQKCKSRNYRDQLEAVLNISFDTKLHKYCILNLHANKDN